MAVGVYVIQNRINRKRYVGESLDVKKRWAEHRRDLSKGKHHCKRLQADYNKYPSIVFKYRVRERFFFTKHFVNHDKLILTLLLREGFWMDYYNSTLDFNSEDSLADLKKFCDTGKGNPKFKRYRKYRRWVRRHIRYGTRWRTPLAVASLYNPVVRVVRGGILLWAIYYCLHFILQLA